MMIPETLERYLIQFLEENKNKIILITTMI